MILQSIHHYRIERELGEGGMAGCRGLSVELERQYDDIVDTALQRLT